MRLDIFLAPRAERSWRRSALRRLGPTWAASPWRRLSQTTFLALFFVLFLYVAWPYGGAGYVASMRAQEMMEAETFLDLDPLVPITTALAARAWYWVPPLTHVIIWLCILFPRAFCGYVCPFGTLLDCFDRIAGRRVERFRVHRRGHWVYLKYYLLAATLVASVFGVLLSSYVAAIPVLTRGVAFIATPLQIGALKGWYLVPPMNAGHVLSLALFVGVFLLSFLRPRFWCCYVCPTGASLSAGTVIRLTERQVESTCIHCGQCAQVCPFDAIREDHTTRTADCTFCQTCGAVCPTQSIRFAPRWRHDAELAPAEPSAAGVALSRRGFLAGAAGAGVAALGIEHLAGAKAHGAWRALPVRPPGSLPEDDFLRLCIRCGECFQACPNNALHPLAFEQGLEGIWTPQVVARWSGCEPTCNNCGLVCPTGAIRPLALEEKAAARIGLAIVSEATCLPLAGREDCRICYDECEAAGYHAVEFMRVGVRVDGQGAPIEESGFLAPVVLAEKCVGCGLCETRCHAINVVQKRLLKETAIRVEAGPGKEDRLRTGSYRALREREREARRQAQEASKPSGADSYLPDFLQ